MRSDLYLCTEVHRFSCTSTQVDGNMLKHTFKHTATCKHTSSLTYSLTRSLPPSLPASCCFFFVQRHF